MSAFFLSAAIIFVAELGDKSQLVALWFATRFRWWVVLGGVAVATLVVHLGSVAVGRAFGELLPEQFVLMTVGVSFFAFAGWSLRGDQFEPSERDSETISFFRAFGVVTASFFAAELGDKTQLATVSLAGTTTEAIGVWLGSTAGMVIADALAIGVGLIAGARLPHRVIRVGAAAIFVIFGILAFVRAVAA